MNHILRARILCIRNLLTTTWTNSFFYVGARKCCNLIMVYPICKHTVSWDLFFNIALMKFPRLMIRNYLIVDLFISFVTSCNFFFSVIIVSDVIFYKRSHCTIVRYIMSQKKVYLKMVNKVTEARIFYFLKQGVSKIF